MGGQAMRGYTLDVSEYLFRLTTESLRIHSNQTRRYQSLGNLVNARATAGAAGAIEQHDVETLRNVVAAHGRSIPFENLDPLLGVPVSDLSAQALGDKLITRRRGGYCYEHNGLLGYALDELGYGVERLAGRVVWMKEPDAPLPALTHNVLAVTVPDEAGRFLVDVGFGGQTLSSPIRLHAGAVQQTRHEPYRLLELQRFGDRLGLPIHVQPTFFPVAPDDAARLRDAAVLGDAAPLFSSVIRHSTSSSKAARDRGILVHELAEQVDNAEPYWIALKEGRRPERVPGTAPALAEDYVFLCEEILKRIDQLESMEVAQ